MEHTEKNESTLVKIAYDRHHIPVHLDSIEKLIREEMHRLAQQTGLPGDGLPITFTNGKSETIACFRYQVLGNVGKPIGFQFSLYQMSALSARQLVEVVRHEFAHYVRLKRHGVCQEEGGHDELWKKICVELDCPPDRYHHAHVTQVFHYPTKPGKKITKAAIGMG